jgi:hypothetical protein
MRMKRQGFSHILIMENPTKSLSMTVSHNQEVQERINKLSPFNPGFVFQFLSFEFTLSMSKKKSTRRNTLRSFL